VQAPAWNSITKAFSKNSKVAFGDVNLAEQDIRGDYDPGAGGWPTIRYFNKETGLKGRPYTKKTDDAMCDELGNEEYMQAYVEEAGGVMLCEDFDCLCGRKEGGCAKKEVDCARPHWPGHGSMPRTCLLGASPTRARLRADYNKFKDEQADVIQSRLRILSGSLAKAAKKDEWMSQRVAILKLLAATSAAGGKQEL
jgi:hypothetical protein